MSMSRKPTGPMRVAIFEPFGNLYGSERSMLDLLSALPSDEVTPVVYCPKGAPWLGELEKHGVRYVADFERDLHLRGRLSRIAALLRFMRFLLKERVQLIHANQTGAAPYALMAGALLRIPVVVHARWPEDHDAINSWKLGLPALRAIVCASNYQIDRVLTLTNTPAAKVVLVRNPYTPRPQADEHSMGEPASVTRFACPARIHPLKRQDLLVRAVKTYTQKTGPCLVQFMGEEAQGSGYLDHLQELAREDGVESSIEFLGYVANVHSRLRGAAAMVLPTQLETVGRVVFEAWEAGTLPVAWSGSGGPAEIIGAADGGVLYPEQTPEALAEAMSAAVSLPPARRREMIENGLRWIAENCAREEHAKNMFGVWCAACA